MELFYKTLKILKRLGNTSRPLALILTLLMPISVYGNCPDLAEMMENAESKLITVEETVIDEVGSMFIISLPNQHKGLELQHAYLTIGDNLNMQGLIPLRLEPYKDGYLTHFTLHSGFKNGAYIKVMYDKCNVLGKTARPRSKVLGPIK